MISIKKHNSKIVIIAGHYDCAASPVGKSEHYRQIREAVKKIKTWNLDADVYGIWISQKCKAELV